MNIFKRLAEKPWIHEPGVGAETRTASFAVSNQKVALVLFLAIVGVLFFLFFAAYHMRIELTSDWVAIPEPPLLWFNTVVLGIASVAFEWARGAARGGREGTARTAFLIAGALTLSFLVLQLVVWDQMLGLGYFAHSNPANSFFYLITAVHGLHLVGGLVAWGRALTRFRSMAVVDGDADGDMTQERLARLSRSVDLCALYWHFLLLVWLGMMAMFLNT